MLKNLNDNNVNNFGVQFKIFGELSLSSSLTSVTMRFFFIVQGEGRGHMTQAIALAALLRKHGHLVDQVVVGRSDRRSIPDFFFEGIDAEVTLVYSPNFVTDEKSKSIHIWSTLATAVSRLGRYRQSIRTIQRLVQEDKPDIIINFYDFIGGIYNFLKSPKAKFIPMGHQYLAGHSSFEFADGRLFDKVSFKLGNWLTSLGSERCLALSFQEYPDEEMAVVPPLLRKEVNELRATNEGYLLIYLLNHGYAEEVEAFHREHPEQVLHCFWDNPDAPQKMKIDATLTYHQLDGKTFLKFLASCKGYVTTAGFESVCEAMQLGKPVMMVPVGGHYEQVCNALDAVKAGAGVSAHSFDLNIFLDYLPRHKTDNERFKGWCDRAESIYLQNLTQA